MDKDIDKPIVWFGEYVKLSAWDKLASRTRALETSVKELETSLEEELENRDTFSETITDCAAMFGDYEWRAKIPSEDPPNSGDLNKDLPELITRCLARVDELEEAIEGVSAQLDTFINNPNDCIEAQLYIKNVNSYLKDELNKDQ